MTKHNYLKALDPDMPAQELRLHLGELTASEVRVARAAIRWANAHNATPADQSHVSAEGEILYSSTNPCEKCTRTPLGAFCNRSCKAKGGE